MRLIWALAVALFKTMRDAIKAYRAHNKQYKALAEYFAKPWICRLWIHDWRYVSYGGVQPPQWRACPLCRRQQIYSLSIIGWYYGDNLTDEQRKRFASVYTQIMLENQEEITER